ncbi:glycoside hydrolase family 95-like protein [Enterococcus nangangensis]|uniref:glycoside hydrolase family 95-like protein n=1 Tax=Enterococcus nangangensis TaxID=2559926 RepID=UPI0035312233
MQYYDGKLKILPALPQAWPKGAIRGARIPGNVSLDIAWENGELTALVIHGTLAQATVVYVKNKKVGTLKEASIQEALSLVQG